MHNKMICHLGLTLTIVCSTMFCVCVCVIEVTFLPVVDLEGKQTQIKSAGEKKQRGDQSPSYVRMSEPIDISQ